jgi:hypothetical protein
MFRSIRTIKLLMLAAAMLLTAAEVRAAKVEFVKEHTYRAGDMDSRVSSRAIALLEVKRALLEQLGTYLVSETEVRNFQLTKDQISVLTAGIMSAEIIEERWDGREFYLKAKLIVDPQEVAVRVRAISRDRERTHELEEARRRTDQALREMERLKKDMGLARPDIQGQVDRQAEYSRAIQELGVDDGYTGHRFLMKDGTSFIWMEYEESGDSYCTYLAAGRVCIPMRDVASIKRGQYPEKAEVISGRPTDEWTRRKAEHDWEAIQTENERAQKAVACGQLSEGLKQLRRESAEYKVKYDEYQSACSGEKTAPAPKRGDSGTSRRRDKKQGDPDKIMKNANEGSVF